MRATWEYRKRFRQVASLFLISFSGGSGTYGLPLGPGRGFAPSGTAAFFLLRVLLSTDIRTVPTMNRMDTFRRDVSGFMKGIEVANIFTEVNVLVPSAVHQCSMICAAGRRYNVLGLVFYLPRASHV